MRAQHPLATIIAGLASAALFILPGVMAESGYNLFPLLPFFSPLPLFIIGFTNSAKTAALAGAIACIAILPVSSLQYSLFYALIFVAPVLLYVYKFHQPLHPALSDQGMVAWTPLSQIIIAVTSLYVVLQVIAAVSLVNFTNEYGSGISAFFHEALVQSARLQEMPADQVSQLEAFHENMPILHAVGVWTVLLLLFANAAIGHNIARSLGTTLRPHLRLDNFHYPAWMLVALMLAGIAAFFGSALIAYIGQVVFIIYLLPYLISGMYPLHRWVQEWPFKEAIIAAAYFFLVMIFMLALILALYAVIKQCIFVSKTLTAA